MSKNDTESLPQILKSPEKNSQIPDEIWMLRSCGIYKEEHRTCTDKSGRKHQKFTLGYEFDCSKWLEDYENCEKFYREEDIEAVKKVIENEKARRKERTQNSLKNDIWQLRDEPPSDWNEPLPDCLEKETFLKKADILMNPEQDFESRDKTCIIL